MRTEITLQRLTPMLNGKNGLKRMHHQKYKKIRDDVALEIRSETKQKHKGEVVIRFIRYSTAQPDWDNLYSAFKVIGDGLVTAGIIRDDSMDVVLDLNADWKKVSKRKYQRTEIIIEDV